MQLHMFSLCIIFGNRDFHIPQANLNLTHWRVPEIRLRGGGSPWTTEKLDLVGEYNPCEIVLYSAFIIMDRPMIGGGGRRPLPDPSRV